MGQRAEVFAGVAMGVAEAARRMKTPLCIYHGNCADGFGSAWVVKRHFKGAVEFHAGVYQNPPPDVTGRNVIIVDFSYKRAVLEEMSKTANTILILDHHKTAAVDLDGIEIPDGGYYPEQWKALSDLYSKWPVRALFDMERSGARLTWDFFNPGVPAPKLIRYIEDRDLWKFSLPDSRAFNANVFSHPYDFDTWDYLAVNADDEGGFAMLITAGDAIERKHNKDVMELVSVMRRRMTIGGISIPVANMPYTLVSDAANLMAMNDETKIGACYWDTAEGRVFGLRSTNDGPDVSEVAKKYGGGGHAHSAGFRMPFGWEGDSA